MGTTSTQSNAPTPPILNPTANTAKFMLGFAISVPLCIIIIFVYCLIRRLFPKTFEIRRKLAPKLNKKDQHDRLQRPFSSPRLSNGHFTWIWEIFMMDDQTFYIHAGFDALIFRLFLKGCTYICLASLPYSLCVLLPIYATSELKDEASDIVDLISMTSIGPNSPRMYAVVVGLYILILVALYYLCKVYLVIAYVSDKYLIDSNFLSQIDSIYRVSYKKLTQKIIDLKMNLAQKPMNFMRHISEIEDDQSEWSERERSNDHIVIKMPKLDRCRTICHSPNQIVTIPNIDRYTVMFKDLPKQFQNKQNFECFMNELFPNKIAQIIMVPNVDKLDKIHQQIKKHEKIINNKSLCAKLKCCGSNTMEYHKNCKNALIEKFNKMKQSQFEFTPTAFVIFKSLTEACNCISCPIRIGLQTLKIDKAPHPNDVIWQNLRFTSSDLVISNIFVAICMVFLLIFWSIPVGAIQVLANLDRMLSLFGWSAEKTFYGKENVSTLQSLLSVFVLDLWLNLLPNITESLTKIQRKTYKGRNEMLFMTKFFDCLLFMVLLVTVVAGSTLNGAQTIADYANRIVSLASAVIDVLADGLSKMSIYFLLYVLSNALIWIPLQLWRPGYFAKRAFGISEPERFWYSEWWAKTMLIFTILLTYSAMMPLMSVFGAIYFIFANFVFSYNLSMNYVNNFEIGPKHWPLVFGRLRFSFMISIFTMFGLMALKKAYVCAVLLLPLAVFVWFFMGNLNVKFRTVFRCTSLTSAHTMDQNITKMINNGDENSFNHLGDAEKLKYLYLPPVMSVEYEEVSNTDYKAPHIEILTESELINDGPERC